METHEKPEPKSRLMLEWVVKRVKSEIKPKHKGAIELKSILKTRQLKLRKPTIREPTVVSNSVRPRPPRRPRKSKQPPVDTIPFAATARLTNPDLDKKAHTHTPHGPNYASSGALLTLLPKYRSKNNLPSPVSPT